MPSAPLLWFLVGVVFLVAELFVPAFVLIFFAAGSWVTALVVWLFKMGLSIQITVFIFCSLLLLLTLRRYGLKTFKGETRGDADDDYTQAKIGKTAVVTRTIAPGMTGEIKCMGSFWRATADEEIAKGRSVVIVSQQSEDGLTFRVTPQ